MKKRIYILCGPAGIGKNEYSQTIADALGCYYILSEGDLEKYTDIPEGALVITNNEELAATRYDQFNSQGSPCILFKVLNRVSLEVLVRALTGKKDFCITDLIP